MGFDFGIVDFFIDYMYIVFNSHFLEDAHLLYMIVYRVHDLFAACFDNRLCIPQFSVWPLTMTLTWILFTVI